MKNINPFYIYTDKNVLYIKNINGQTERLSNNIHSYCATIDNSSNIHICALDTRGRLNHFFKHNGSWKKKSILKALNTTKNIKDMRLYSIDDSLNVFIVEKYPLSDNLHKLSHFNFDVPNYRLSKYIIDNVLKDNGYFYKLDIDDFSNIVLEYKPSSSSDRTTSKLFFNSSSKQWSKSNIENTIHSSRCSNEGKTTIKDDIFEYCYGITYKI